LVWFRFYLKKIIKLIFFEKTEIGLNQLVLIWFFEQKPVQTGLAWFFR
jgi:hypothetical protein